MCYIFGEHPLSGDPANLISTKSWNSEEEGYIFRCSSGLVSNKICLFLYFVQQLCKELIVELVVKNSYKQILQHWQKTCPLWRQPSFQQNVKTHPLEYKFLHLLDNESFKNHQTHTLTHLTSKQRITKNLFIKNKSHNFHNSLVCDPH